MQNVWKVFFKSGNLNKTNFKFTYVLKIHRRQLDSWNAIEMTDHFHNTVIISEDSTRGSPGEPLDSTI